MGGGRSGGGGHEGGNAGTRLPIQGVLVPRCVSSTHAKTRRVLGRMCGGTAWSGLGGVGRTPPSTTPRHLGLCGVGLGVGKGASNKAGAVNRT